ncbi:hypothetical protein K2173_004940 [Erythroxylum novogranatense]|uniref:AB hydrolase-1 domain-containing protein n=1 Tax=Erythroxylum novogranatense TaxID=1862640 RepID=A0AAV8TCP4_9ROSI|nr:hypothetical protein K2173_004940 [Erythroxylum novogranatense]
MLGSESEAEAEAEAEVEVGKAEAAPIKVVQKQQHHFVLVHGLGGGGWCWYKVRCLMENSGYKVSCIDLKSSGIDPTSADSVLTFDDYNKPLIDFISSLPDHHQVILVGHSAGGLSITQAIHKFRGKIRLAVYIAATMLRLGFWTHQDFQDGVPDLSSFGDVLELGFGLGDKQPPTSAIVKKEFQRKIIYQLSPPEVTTLAAMLLRPGPLMALQSAQFTAENDAIEEVRRVYIKTTRDNVVKPQQQDAMIQRWPPSAVYVLDSDHSPFFSSPFLLFGLLVKAAASID